MANKNTTRSQVKHTEVVFEPLRISCSIQCVTPASPLVQVSNALLNEYEPDREFTPCVIRPFVEVRDPDKVFVDGNVNERLSIDSIKWFFNGVPIQDIPEFAGKYEIIQTENELRGSIRILRNIPVTERYVISFEAQFEDWRRGKIETAQSNELTMSTSDIGEDIYRISTEVQHIVYRPVLDNLLIYDYMVGAGLHEGGNRESYKDMHSFERRVVILLNSGDSNVEALPDDLDIELREKGGGPIVPGSILHPEVSDLQFPHIDFDLRLIEKKEYELRLKRGEKILSRYTFSIRREDEPVHECMPMFGSDISPHQQMYFNRALVSLKDHSLAHPEIWYRIEWFTQARIFDSISNDWIPAGEKKHNLGVKLSIPVAEIGVGRTKNNNYFEVGFDVTPHGAASLAMDTDGHVFTDNEGNRFLI